MTTPEDRLRNALAASAALFELDEDPLPLTARAPSRHRTHWYVPVVVATVVLALVAAGFFIARRSTPAPATPPPPIPAAAPYLIANVASGSFTGASIREVRTGRVTSTVPPPTGAIWDAVAATANPRLFYLSADAGAKAFLYRLTIDDRGRTQNLTRVANLRTSFSDLVGIAASPDGTRIAEPIINPGSRPAEIDVFTVTGGQSKEVTYRTSMSGDVSDLSWSADGRYLAFVLHGSANADTVRVLDTRAGRDLIAGSRLFPGWTDAYTNPVLSADGNGLYAIAGWTIREMDIRTGRPVRILAVPRSGHSGGIRGTGITLIRDPTGRLLLIIDGTGHIHIIDVVTGAATGMPFTHGIPYSLSW